MAGNRGLESISRRTAGLAGAVAVTVFVAWYVADSLRDPGLASLAIAAWLWAAMLGWLVVVQWILGLQLEFGKRFHGPKAFELSSRPCRALGVPQARRFMPHGHYANRVVRAFTPEFRVIAGQESAREWEATTRSKEACHLLHLAMTLPVVGYAAANGWFGSTSCLVALDVVCDLYPALVQRYNRIRILRLLEGRRHAGAHDGVAAPG